MKKIFTSNSKLKYSLLSILFSILFIFTALNISNPITVYADDDTPQIGQVLNLGAFSANETDESSNEQAGYLYWAASGDRSGIYYYVIDDKGNARAQGVILDDAGKAQYGNYGSKCTSGKIIAVPKITTVSTLGMPSAQYQPNVSPVFYSGGWQSKGSESMAYFTEIVGEIVIKGYRMPCPRWAKLVAQQSGGEVLESLAEPDTKWTVFVEPVSVGYMYTDGTFSKKTANTVHKKADFEANSPKPMGTMNADGSFTPRVYGSTARLLLEKSVAIGDSGQYRYKFYETQLPFSLCLDHDAQYCQFVGGVHTTGTTVNACNKPVQRVSHIEQNEGIAIAALDITGFSLPPIHTFGGATPGNTENPEPPKDGNCTIKKLYYTQIIASDGTILTEATDYHHYTQTLTTNYISIDNEEGYEIEGWKTSTSDRAFTQKSHYNGILPVKQSGTSSDVITLDETTGEKYLYVLLKKTEIETNPPDPWDFQLKQSQITKRVTFLESSGPANTPDLIIHNFKWTAPAPAITSCIAHGGDGHKYNHSCGYLSCSTWYTHPCSSFQWTDNTTKLGIKIDTTAINKAVVSKNHEVTYNATTVNTIESDVTHMGLFFCIFLDIADNLEFQIKPSI